jgi:hypothetical protein
MAGLDLSKSLKHRCCSQIWFTMTAAERPQNRPFFVTFLNLEKSHFSS